MQHRTMCAVLVLGMLASSTPAFAQQPHTRIRSGKVALAGLVTAVVGAFQFAPVGQDYDILGSRYCATGAFTLNAGSCQVSAGRRPLGFALLAAGGVMMGVGLSRVQVSPTYKGAKATMTLTW